MRNSLALQRENERARRDLVAGHAEDIRDGDLFRRVVRLEARFHAVARIDREVVETEEMCAPLGIRVANANAEARTVRARPRGGWPQTTACPYEPRSASDQHRSGGRRRPSPVSHRSSATGSAPASPCRSAERTAPAPAASPVTRYRCSPRSASRGRPGPASRPAL